MQAIEHTYLKGSVASSLTQTLGKGEDAMGNHAVVPHEGDCVAHPDGQGLVGHIGKAPGQVGVCTADPDFSQFNSYLCNCYCL